MEDAELEVLAGRDGNQNHQRGGGRGGGLGVAGVGVRVFCLSAKQAGGWGRAARQGRQDRQVGQDRRLGRARRAAQSRGPVSS